MYDLLITAIVAFVLGFITGFGFTGLLALVFWTAFWLLVGSSIVLLIDLLSGLGETACAVRQWVHELFDWGSEPAASAEIIPLPVR